MGSAKHSMCALEDSCRYLGVAVAAMALTACSGGAGSSDARSTSLASTTSAQATTTSTTVTTPPPSQDARIAKWIDLQVGECLADPPPTDPSVVTVSVVDCAVAHAAEVYLRADVEVNAAIADVADRECDAGFARYTGQSVSGGPLAVTYLIDSNQDRTSANPLPSTVICVLTASNGGPLTGSARR
jgi:hypothetical protein